MRLIMMALCIQALVAHSQPVKIWSKIFGGNASDVANAMIIYNDTTIISVGRSSSVEIAGHRGGDDFLLCNLNPSGTLRYLKTYGGPSIDQANSVRGLPTGELLMGGFTGARGGDVSGLHGLNDIWIIAVNPFDGKLIWQKNFGGTNNDQLNALHYLEMGRIFMAGHTKSIDRDVATTPSKGGNDILISSLNEAGVINKTVTFGGTKDETVKKILNAEEFGGQMLVFGETESGDFDFQGMAKGKKDIFILKVNRNLTKIFMKTIGGAGDDLFGDALKLSNNTYLLFGTVNTKGGPIDSIKGAKDIWLTKIDIQGNILWSKTIGGSLDDVPYQAKFSADGNVILVSNSNSNDKDIKITPHGGTSDVLLMKLDTSGNVIWQKFYGGTKGDNASALATDNSGHIYLTASSFSLDFDLSPSNINAPDFWTLKLFECHDFVENFNVSICENDSIAILGKFFSKRNQTGTVRLIGGNYLGCDSIVNIQIELIPPQFSNAEERICHDSSLVLHHILFDKNHTEDTFFLKSTMNGCDSIVSFKVSFLDPLEVMDTLIIKDDGTGKGCIGVQMKGGCEPYKYKWSTGWTASNVCNLLSGRYTLTVTDCKNCERDFSFFVPSTVAVEDESSKWPKFMQNPSEIIIHWEGETITGLSIYDLFGRQITELSPNASISYLKRDQFINGLYAIRMSTKSGRIFKILFTI
ncbi:MAG: hypothetical protein IPM92_05885 [Saprospiraceae bacterium]|nr:hypothetical protein [Saprospiraceae bacterium]